ncbi:hypothetical protein B0O99DRAFT_652886 [Bisporella sp. PMI_857]|nr:hypothetical protein B0O99DRAFT_652886 [Bisporella sp. PMI_857]
MLSHARLVSFILALLVASLNALPISDVDSAEPLATNTTDTLSVGWVSSSPTRGTVDIIWTCTITMFLCSWSVQCMQIPGKEDSRFDIIWRRCWLTALCALGPEFTFQLALGEWASARQSVNDFHASGLSHWSMKHAFFADSGGFFLCTPDFKPIPIDAKQLLYLVNRKYIECPMLSKKMIDDKNKMDVLLRFLTIAQTIWFIATVIARHEQGLVVTGMEVTTAAFILCSFGTTFCWWHKGADVVMPEMLTTTVTMVDILKNAGNDWAGPYHRTPLDFISRVEWHWSLYWKHWINILRKMHIVFAPAALPHDRFENTIWREVKGRLLTVFIIVSFAYSAVFVTLWNSHFPTSAERLLWRLSSLHLRM